MLSRKYKCPICGTFLQERVLPFSPKEGEIHINYQLECDLCGIFAKSICDCKDSCTCDYHYNQAFNSMHEKSLFLKTFLIEGLDEL